VARSKKPVSHDAGGPSASRGTAYQVYFAIYRTLDLIVRHFAAPHKALTISIEPRVVHRDSGSVTAWDMLFEADAIVWEAKLKVTRQDLIEWLQRIRNTDEARSDIRFGLVHSQTDTPLLAALGRFHRVAVECEGNHARFDALALDNDRLKVVATTLGTHFREHLRQMEFLHAPESVLKNAVEDRANYLAGAHSNQLIDFLFRTFSEGAAERKRYAIAELIESIRREEITLTPPPALVLADVPIKARETILALTICSAGFPQL